MADGFVCKFSCSFFFLFIVTCNSICGFFCPRRHSSLSVYDHPIVLDYLKTYDHVKVFKEGLAQAFSEKGKDMNIWNYFISLQENKIRYKIGLRYVLNFYCGWFYKVLKDV